MQIKCANRRIDCSLFVFIPLRIAFFRFVFLLLFFFCSLFAQFYSGWRWKFQLKCVTECLQFEINAIQFRYCELEYRAFHAVSSLVSCFHHRQCSSFGFLFLLVQFILIITCGSCCGTPRNRLWISEIRQTFVVGRRTHFLFLSFIAVVTQSQNVYRLINQIQSAKC